MADIIGEVGTLVGDAVGGAATGGIGTAVGGFFELLNKFVPDKNQQAALVAEKEKEQAEYALKLLDVQAGAHAQEIELLKGQTQTNTAEAANSNLFVSGWRAFAGWAATATTFGGVWCGVVMLFLGKTGSMASELAVLLSIPTSILFGMLGLHSAERKWGVAPDQSPDGAPTPAPPRAILVKK